MGGCAHPELVILTYEYTGQIPQLGHVVCLKHLTLVSGPVPI